MQQSTCVSISKRNKRKKGQVLKLHKRKTKRNTGPRLIGKEEQIIAEAFSSFFFEV